MNRSSEISYCVYPCPCGYYGDPTKECSCSPSIVTRYQIDIHIEVPRVPYEKLTGERLGGFSSLIAARVEAARERQRQRFAGQNSHIVCNADMTPADVRVFCKLDATGQSLMRSAMQQLQLSARAFHRVLKIARMIADLARSDEIALAHLAEAIQYRPRRQE